MEKQFQVRRAISSYDKTTEKLVDEVSISLTLEQLKTVFTPCPDDPFLYYVYPISQQQAIQLHQLVNIIQLDMEQFDYQLECYQIST